MYKRILVPVDGSEASRLGLDEAIKLAKGQSAKLRLVHVVDELVISGTLFGDAMVTGSVIESLRESGKKVLKDSEALLARAGIDSESELIEHFGGATATRVIDEATKWKADLIVLGTHGRRGLKRLVLGSDAEEIVRTSPVPILLVRAPVA